MSTTITPTEQNIDINVTNDVIDINVTNSVVDVNATAQDININVAGAYPLPNSVFSVFGRVGDVVAAEGDYTLTQLGDVTITNPITDNILKYNGTAWVNGVNPNVGTVTSVAALTLGTSGTDLSSTVANSTTTPVITLNVPTASATNRGALSSADWTTFNSKQAALNGTGFVKISGTTISYDNSTYYLASNPSSYIPLTALSAGAGISYNNTTGVIASTITQYTDAMARAAISGGTGISYNSTTGVITNTITQYTDALARAAISLTTTGTSGAATYNNTTGVLNIPQYADQFVGTVTSVAITESGDALTITGSPITTSGTINIGFAGANTQYVRGDGTLATFPSIISQAANLVTEVYNKTGATLTKGTIVYINGGQGNLPTITKALATGDSTSAQTFGVVQSDITNNNNGYVVVAGKLSDLDTQAYTEGTQLYLSATTAGTWTSTKQYAPNHLVYVGIVVRAHPTQGIVEIKIQNGYEMDELHNVAAQNPDNNDILQYKTSTSLWTKVAGTTSNIAEGTNLYYTEGRVSANTDVAANTAARHNAVTLGTANGLSLSTQVLSLALASGSTTGALSSTDWTTFNGKQNALNGTGFVKISGTTISYDNSTYYLASNPNGYTSNTGTVTSVGLSSATSGVTIGSSPITTSGTITLAIATASGSAQGLLSSSDWTSFNSKQGALTLTTTGTSGAATLIGDTLNIPQYSGGGGGGMAIGGSITSATAGSVLFAGASGVLAQDNANFFWDDTNNRLGLGTTTPALLFDVAFSSAGDGIRTYNTLSSGFADVRVGNNTNNNLGFLRVGGSTSANIYTNSLVVGTGGGFDVKIAPNGAVGLLVQNGGRVGVGSETVATWSDATINGSNKSLAIGVGTNGNGGFLDINANSTAGYFWANHYYDGQDRNPTTGFSPRIQVGASTNIISFFRTTSQAAGSIISSTENARFDASGNLGLGTTTIGSKLQVNGNAAIGYSASTAAPTNGLAVSGKVGIGSTSVTNGTTYGGANQSNLLKLSSSGYPALEINSTNDGGGSIQFTNGTNLPNQVRGLVGYNSGGTAALDLNINNIANGAIKISTNNTDRLTITNGGQVTLATGANVSAIAQTGYSLTGSNAQSLLDLAGTWNTTGNPTAIKLNITNTASGANADLMELQVGGVSQFLVSKAGNTEMTGSIKTGEPDTGYGRAAIKIGARNTGEAFDSGGHLPVNIDGTIYYINVYSSLP